MSFPSHNLAVVVGSLSSPPKRRTLPSGVEFVQIEVTTRPVDGPTASVPVSVDASRISALALEEGSEVVVIGQVRRRFFRVGGITQSRTEVVATEVIPARRKLTAARALARAATVLTDA